MTRSSILARRTLLVAALLWLPMSACRSSAPPRLEGAVYKSIPVFVPSKLVERGGFTTESGEGLIWTLHTDASYEKVKQFYQRLVPAGSEYDGGNTGPDRQTWEYRLPEMAESERLQVTVKRQGKGADFSISEVVAEGKRRRGL